MNNKRLWTGLCVVIIAIFSMILTIPSMWLIKNTPGNSFKTDFDFIATALLVFVLWFSLMTFCVWLVGFLVNLRKLKKNPYNTVISERIMKKNKDLKTISIVRRIIIGFLNLACMYFLIVFSVNACLFLGFGGANVGWILFVIANVCIILLLLVCAISDFIMMIKIFKNPYDKKAMNVREKGKKVFGTLIIVYIFLYLLMLICLLLFNH